MAQFRKKPVVIEAEQYFVGQPLPKGAKATYPQILFSRDGKLYYITHTKAADWLSVAKDEQGKLEALPFSMYSVKSGEKLPIEDYPELVQQYLNVFKIPQPVEYAWVETIHAGQAVKLENGDYVIPEPDGEHYYPCKPDIFEATYDKVE